MKPRIRAIKPEAFDDEELWDLEQQSGRPLFRAFAGLWCLADREGRFEWRPRVIKKHVLPYWEGDIDRVLSDLCEGKFIMRYEADGKTYGVVRNFLKHQKVNIREAQSIIPAPPSTCTHVRAPVEGKGRERKGREGEGKETCPTPAEQTRAVQSFEASFRGTCPDELILDKETRELAKELDLSAFGEFDAMRDNARSKGLTSSDWNADLRTWMRRSHRWAAERRQKPERDPDKLSKTFLGQKGLRGQANH